MAESKDFQQTTAATTWAVSHNLNTLTPVVEVLLDIYEGETKTGRTNKAFPKDIRIIDANNVEIDFSDPQTGIARFM